LEYLLKHIQLIICSTLFLLVTVNSAQGKSSDQQILNSRAILEETLISHEGKVVYLDFWASWCGPCRKSFPWMNTMQEQFKHEGFSVISINLDANKDLAEKFLKENPARFTVIYDPKGNIAKHFKIQGMPSSMLIGRDGKIKSSHTGFFTNKTPKYQQEIEELLAIKVMK